MPGDPIAELRTDLRKRMFDRLDKRSASFTTLFGGLLAFALIFGAVVLVPYLRLGQQQSAIAARVEAIGEEVELKRKRVADLLGQVDLITLENERQQLEFGGATFRLTTAEADSAKAARAAQEAAAKLADANAAAAEAQRRAEALATLPRTLPQFRIDPEREARELAAFLSRLEPAYFRDQLPDAQGCRRNDRDEWLGCIVHAHVRARGDAIMAQLRADLVERAAAADPSLRTELEAKVASFRSELDRRLIENPRFWTRFDAKLALSGEIARVLERSVADLLEAVRADTGRLEEEARAARAQSRSLAEAVEPLREAAVAAGAAVEIRRAQADALREERDKIVAAARVAKERLEMVRSEVERETIALEKERVDLEADRARLEQDRVEIARRLERIQTPFGTLPIGATDGILVFPVVLAAGFLVVAIALADAARLKGELRRELRALDPDGRASGDERLALAAPLWFDAVRGAAARLGLAVVFALPAIVALAAAAMNVAEWQRPGSRLAGPDLRLAYGLLYVLATALIALGIAQVIVAFARLSRGSRSADARGATASAIG